ncbi:hypothetical protein [Nocardioides luteus]|uniref:Uncharacterized protein n=1 Tax=Nocardioides luteus TaxID=1844 RepID=A0A1J4MXD6_9ACTN|nr:hypothetical protein [Nocardioides luteus]OIJ24006.1 hypothetical protein UG56_024920 [Nocardioides luteus]
MRRTAALAAGLLIGSLLAACGTAEPQETDWPDGLTAYVDQTRLQRNTGEAFVRLVNDTGSAIEVSHLEVGSDRFRARWTGSEPVDPEMDFDFPMPRGKCGEGGDADLTITWRKPGEAGEAGEWRTSTGTAEDRYANIERLLDRDCAERTLTDAAEITVGEPRVEGEGKQRVFVLPITFTPTEKAPDVTFDGWEGTVLFQLATETPTWPRATPHPMTGDPVTRELRVLPARCDPHALADDKVGSLFRVHVGGPDVPDGASYFLILDQAHRRALYDFLPGYCGWE